MSTKCLPKYKFKNEFIKSSYRCKICKNSFQEFTVFEGHFAFNVTCRAKNGWFIQCYVCRQKFRYLAELKFHMRLHTVQSSKKLERSDCKINNRAISNENGNSHSNGFQCNICQRKCRTKFYLNKHLLSHSKETISKKTHINGEPDVQTVDQVPSSNSEVPSHKMEFFNQAKERDREKTTHAHGLKCERCNLAFTKEILLNIHRKLFHQSDTSEKPNRSKLQCDICQARFTFAGNLKRHKLIHTTGDVECKICQVKFTKTTLVTHEREAHLALVYGDTFDNVSQEMQPNNEITTPPIATRNITPPIASDSITQPIEVEVPTAYDNITPSIAVEKTKPPTTPAVYNCSQCRKSVSSNHHLQLHLKTHRKWPCWICGKTFKTKAGMRSHSRSHRFECYICKVDLPSSFRHLVTHIGKHQVYEQWVDPVDVYLSNWNPKISREILQNQPLVMVERLDLNNTNLTSPVILDKSKRIGTEKVKDEPQMVESIANIPPIMNGESYVDGTEVKYSEKFDNSPYATVKTQPSKCVVDHRALSDDDEIIFVEQEADTTTSDMDDNVVDISSESDIDEMELFHCYFCNETFRSLDSLGVHVKKCSYCP